jgi:hypothetical protein
MKKTRAMLAPVKTRKIPATESPISAAKAQNARKAAPMLIRLMPKPRSSTIPSGASITILRSFAIGRDIGDR